MAVQGACNPVRPFQRQKNTIKPAFAVSACGPPSISVTSFTGSSFTVALAAALAASAFAAPPAAWPVVSAPQQPAKSRFYLASALPG